jgi:polysaccharide export outer membrane protein
MRLFLMAFCLFLPNMFAAQPVQNPAPSAPAASVPEDFVIGLEDVLSINVWKEPEHSVKEVVVRPDGKISIPLIGEILASGLTPKQLQVRISEQMKEYLEAPNVTVIVLRIASQSVSIVGKVTKPGVYFLGSPITVLELLARSGGFREDANIKKIAIIRKEGERTSYFPFNYKEVSKGQRLQQNIILKNGDEVIVP